MYLHNCPLDSTKSQVKTIYKAFCPVFHFSVVTLTLVVLARNVFHCFYLIITSYTIFLSIYSSNLSIMWRSNPHQQIENLVLSKIKRQLMYKKQMRKDFSYFYLIIVKILYSIETFCPFQSCNNANLLLSY